MFETLSTLLLTILIAGAILIIISEEGNSGMKISWILIITILPIIGILLYICFGINYRHHWYYNKRHKKSKEYFYSQTSDQLNELLFGSGGDDRPLKEIRPKYFPLAQLLSRVFSLKISEDNSVEIITEGKRKFELLVRDIKNAKESIHMEYFQFGTDKGSITIRELLKQKVREGVKVRFINENIANWPWSPFNYFNMKRAGIQVVRFTNPRQHLVDFVTKLNYRNHRKIVVIDGRIAYTGGMNINDDYFKKWRDTHLRIEGDAVASLQFLFIDSWLTAGGELDKHLLDYFPMLKQRLSRRPEEQKEVFNNKLIQIVPDEPNSAWPILQMGYEWAILHSEEYFYLQTPYFVPPEPVLNALKVAAMSGVEVKLMLPRKPDNLIMRAANRAFYRECLEAGIRIFEKGERFIHSKTFISDDYLSSIGTANIDYRSFNINYEVNTYIYDKEVALKNKLIFENDLKYCREVNFEIINNWSWFESFTQKITRLFAPLL